MCFKRETRTRARHIQFSAGEEIRYHYFEFHILIRLSDKTNDWLFEKKQSTKSTRDELRGDCETLEAYVVGQLGMQENQTDSKIDIHVLQKYPLAPPLLALLKVQHIFVQCSQLSLYLLLLGASSL